MARLVERCSLHRVTFRRLACKRYSSDIFVLEDQGPLSHAEHGLDDILCWIQCPTGLPYHCRAPLSFSVPETHSHGNGCCSFFICFQERSLSLPRPRYHACSHCTDTIHIIMSNTYLYILSLYTLPHTTDWVGRAPQADVDSVSRRPPSADSETDTITPSSAYNSIRS